jgi:hypothetical protein
MEKEFTVYTNALKQVLRVVIMQDVRVIVYASIK